MGRTKRKFEKYQGECVVENLPTDWDTDRLSSWFSSAGVDVHSVVKDIRHATWGYVTFASKTDAQTADASLLGERNLTDENTGGDDNGADKAGASGTAGAPESGDNQRNKRPRRRKYNRLPKAKVDPATIDIADIVCPLRNMPYGEQLLQKQSKVTEALQRVTEKVSSKFRDKAHDTPDWLGGVGSRDNMCCNLVGIVRSPQRDGYRNKCEFTFGNDVNEQPTCGFLLGSFKDGITAVAEPKGCIHTPHTTCAVAGWAQEYLREHSKLPVWDKRSNNGFWRLLIVREGRRRTFLPPPGGDDKCEDGGGHTFDSLEWKQWLVKTQDKDAATPAGCDEPSLHVSDMATLSEPTAPPCDEMLVMVQVNDSYTTPEEMAAECAGLGRFLLDKAKAASPQLPLTSLLVQHHSGLSNAAMPDAPVVSMLPSAATSDAAATTDEASTSGAGATGQDYIHDSLCNLTFRVSSGAFFQVNNGAAAVLYRLAGDWVAADGKALLFDVCCGTGTIGLTLAHRVHHVVGIELVDQAIQDAKVNAALNGIENCTWLCGKAEDVMSGLLDSVRAQQQAAESSDQQTAVAGTNGVEGGKGSASQPPAYDLTHIAGFSEVVAIVDPPRPGLHPKVLKALLRCPDLKRIVYVSCNPETLASNVIDLCSPCPRSEFRVGSGPDGDSSVPGWLPFHPVKTAAVDLFPHTKHCEAVMLLERR